FDGVLESKRRREAMRLRIAPDGMTRDLDAEDLSSPLDRERSLRAQSMAALLRGLGVDVDATVRKLARRFAQAGISSPDAPIYYLFFQRIASLGITMIALLLMLQPGEGLDKLESVMLGGFIGVIGIFGPYLYLQNKIDNRKKKLQKAFPDTLDLLLICVESGLALDAALNRVCAELGRAYPEMTAELNRTRLELALLNDRVKALLNLGERSNMVQFRSLVAALIQSERFGTSLTDTLRVLSEDFRLQRLSEVEAKAARLPVILTIPLILLLLPALFMIILGPAAVSYYHPNGK
ncbi:MAG: hypothetical protein B7X02_01310, partial [Rhodospirillales bacterium 12-54-5]